MFGYILKKTCTHRKHKIFISNSGCIWLQWPFSGITRVLLDTWRYRELNNKRDWWADVSSRWLKSLLNPPQLNIGFFCIHCTFELCWILKMYKWINLGLWITITQKKRKLYNIFLFLFLNRKKFNVNRKVYKFLFVFSQNVFGSKTSF
jgi:hypothetical protein